MSRKEKLVAELYDIRNKCQEIKGEGLLDPKHGASLVHNYKVSELENMIRGAELTLRDLKEKKRAEDYYNTTEGKHLKELLEKQVEEIKTKTIKLHTDATDLVLSTIQKRYGENWGVVFVAPERYFEIGIRDKEKDECKFGYGFTVYINDKTQWSLDTTPNIDPSINYGTMGPFNLAKNPDRVEYLQVLADVAKGGEWLNELCQKLLDYGTQIEAHYAILRMVENKLKHPLD